MPTTTDTLWNQEPRTKKSQSGRKITLDWLLDTEPGGGMGGRDKRTYVTLNVRYNAGGHNMFSGQHEQRCYEASLGHETEEDSSIGGVMMMRVFTLFSAIGIWHSDPVGRFSAKRLDESVEPALVRLRELCEAGDERVLAFFKASA